MRYLIAPLLTLTLSMALAAEPPSKGPVIEDFGPVWAVPEGSFNLDPEKEHRIVMDVASGPDEPATLNRSIESAARFLNMHARAGVPAENLKFAVVLHGGAARAALTDEAHASEHEVGNPNAALIRALHGAGVRVFLCGQSAGYRGYAPDDLLPEVELALSAMTVHVRLQQEGYQAILF